MGTETVRVPGEPAFGRTSMIPPILVELPLEVRTRASLQFVRGLLMLAVGMLGMAMAGVALWMIASHRSEGMAWVGVIGCLLPGLLLAVQGPPQAWTCLRDAAQPDPVLIIRSGDIEDRRAGATIPWTAVSPLRIAYTRDYLAHLRLTLRAPIRARHNPFRAGTPVDAWRRRPDTFCIPIALLNVDSGVLAQVVTVLARRHGAEVTASGGPLSLT